MDKRTCVTIEVDRLLGVEGHVFARIHFEDEVFESAEPDNASHVVDFVVFTSGEACFFLGNIASVGNHGVHEVIGIDNGAFARLHLPFGEFHHAIGEVHEVFAPFETEAVEEDREHLEVVVLLVAYDINHLVDGIVDVAELGGADILSHIHRSAVGAEQEFVVETGIGKICPHRAILLAIHDAFFESFEHFFLPFEIGVALVVDFVEIDTEAAVGFVKAGIHPVVHHLPHAAHLLVAVFPLLEHSASLVHERRSLFGILFAHALRHKVGNFGFEVLVKFHIEIADEVVALLARFLGGDSVAPLLPSEHRLADVDTTVVYDVGFHHLVAVCLENFGEAETEEVVAHVPQVERLVGVGRRIFNHHERTILVGFA